MWKFVVDLSSTTVLDHTVVSDDIQDYVRL